MPATLTFPAVVNDSGSGLDGTVMTKAWYDAMAASPIETASITAASPTQLTVSTNNYVIPSATLINLSASGAINLTGLVPLVANQIVVLANIGTFTITLKHESASSTAANRFFFTAAADFALASNGMNAFVYQAASSRWRKWLDV